MTDDQYESFLLRAESVIVRGEMAISRQLFLIERLRQSRMSTVRAEATLKSMEALLLGFYASREKILKQRSDRPKRCVP
jgi:hypothetical protein